MEENKKCGESFREDYEDVIHRQCMELSGWREKYRALERRYGDLKEKYDNLEEESAAMSRELTGLRGKLEGAQKACEEKSAELREAIDNAAVLQRSNVLLEKEVTRLRDKYEDAVKSVNLCRQEVLRLKGRGLFARIFNN